MTKNRLPFVDCARGYAILMVIICHLTYAYPDLPSPLHALTMQGWYGVQFFFIASCYTLLLSWRTEQTRRGYVDVVAFWLRRFFRIAPAYYAAAVLYLLVKPPAQGFDIAQASAWMLFLNGWTLPWMGTPAGSWVVVPGGWSISVEVSLYVVFPLLALGVTSLSRSMVLIAGTVVFGLVANLVLPELIGDHYSSAEISNFRYFWFPNQTSVFALGAVAFSALHRHPGDRLAAWINRRGPAIASVSAAAFVALLFLPRGHFIGASPWVPEHLAAAVPLTGVFLGLSSGRGILVNRAAAAIGRVSFSAYLLHFAVLDLLPFIPGRFGTTATGYAAIAAFAIGAFVTLAITYGLSCLSYRFIEEPGIELGKRVTRRLRPSAREGLAVSPWSDA